MSVKRLCKDTSFIKQQLHCTKVAKIRDSATQKLLLMQSICKTQRYIMPQHTKRYCYHFNKRAKDMWVPYAVNDIFITYKKKKKKKEAKEQKTIANSLFSS